MYLQPGDPGHLERVAQINSVSNAPIPTGLHPAQGQGITTHTAQRIQPTPNQIPLSMAGTGMTNPAPTVATVPALVNPAAHHSPQTGTGLNTQQ